MIVVGIGDGLSDNPSLNKLSDSDSDTVSELRTEGGESAMQKGTHGRGDA